MQAEQRVRVLARATEPTRADAAWVIVKSHDKKRARLNGMRHFRSTLDCPNKDPGVVGAPDPLIVGRAAQVLQPGPGIYDAATHPAMQRGGPPLGWPSGTHRGGDFCRSPRGRRPRPLGGGGKAD
jgi:hypothetical protein